MIPQSSPIQFLTPGYCYEGFSDVANLGTCTGCDIYPSSVAGFWHVAVYSMKESIVTYTKRPVREDAVPETLRCSGFDAVTAKFWATESPPYERNPHDRPK